MGGVTQPLGDFEDAAARLAAHRPLVVEPPRHGRERDLGLPRDLLDRGAHPRDSSPLQRPARPHAHAVSLNGSPRWIADVTVYILGIVRTRTPGCQAAVTSLGAGRRSAFSVLPRRAARARC